MGYSYNRTAAASNYDRRLQASLDEGRGTFTEHLKIHRFHGSVRVTDMENAGKRGKKVRELTIIPKTQDDTLGDKILKQAITSILPMKYDQAKAHLESILDRADHEGLFELHEVVKRGVDVEPMGTKLNLKKEFPDGKTVSIEASPHDFHIVNSVPFGGNDSGKPAFRQDTGYWPVKKQDGILFYEWLKQNMSAAANMTMGDLSKVFGSLGIRYHSH